MSELYHQALRAWEASPEDLEAYTVLIGMCRRFSFTVPDSINPGLQFNSLVEKLRDAYSRMDAAGYDHAAAGKLCALRPPYEDLIALRDEISLLANPDAEFEYHELSLPYPCLKVEGVNPLSSLSFPPIGYTHQKLPEGLVQPFKELAEKTRSVCTRFPDAQFFEVLANYPDDGQVYWNITTLIYLPAFNRSFVLCIQHYW